MPNALARQQVARATAHSRRVADHAATHPAPTIADEWQAHVDAGRIGNRPPMPPAIRANLARTETLFAALTAERCASPITRPAPGPQPTARKSNATRTDNP